MPQLGDRPGSDAAAAADAGGAKVVPPGSVIDPGGRIAGGMPTFRNRTVDLSGVWIDDDGKVGGAAGLFNQRADELRRRAVDADGGDAGCCGTGLDCIDKRRSVREMQSVPATEAHPGPPSRCFLEKLQQDSGLPEGRQCFACQEVGGA